jgi:dephospho-CoA kinase
MKVIGITGGIGSGKSLIAEIMQNKFNAYLINTDRIAHMFMEKGEISYKLITEYFGRGVLNSSGDIDRVALGAVVYGDAEKLLKLNSFTHPYVMDYVRNLIEEKRREKVEFTCVETALPVQAGLKDFCDAVWYVFAPDTVRRERLKQARNYKEQKIDKIFENQFSDFEYRKASTHIIINDCTREKIIEQIEVLLEKF